MRCNIVSAVSVTTRGMAHNANMTGLSPQGLEHVHLLLAHLLRQHDWRMAHELATRGGHEGTPVAKHSTDALVALHRGRHGQPDTRVPRRWLDQRVAGLDPARRLRFLDHSQPDPVLRGQKCTKAVHVNTSHTLLHVC